MTTTDVTPQQGASSLSAHEAMGDLRRPLAETVGLLRQLGDGASGGADTATADASATSASGGGAGLVGVLAAVPTADLPGLCEDVLALRALAEGAATAVLAEAVARGVVAEDDASPRPLGAKVTAWVQARAEAAGAPVTTSVAGQFRRWWEASARPELAPLGAAIRAGRVSLPVGARLAGDLTVLAGSIPPDWWEAAAGELVTFAATGASASQLGSVRDALIANYGADGEFEREQETARRARHFSSPVRDAAGLWVGTYAMDNDSYATVAAALDALAAPCRSADGEVDTRTAGQRNLDAIVELCHVVATDPTLLRHRRPASAARAQVIVTIEDAVLRRRLAETGALQGRPGGGYAVDGRGTPLTPGTVRRLACEAKIIPAVLGTDSAVLDLGRSARLASPDQVRYLWLRDGCCTFPGCDRPPSWCEAHHLDEWEADQGATDVDRLALLCTRHHTDVHSRQLKGDLVDGRVRWRRREGRRSADRAPDRPPGRPTTRWAGGIAASPPDLPPERPGRSTSEPVGSPPGDGAG